MTVRVEVDALGPKAVVKGEWTATDRDDIRRMGARRLDIAVRGSDLAFLRDLDEVEEIKVVDLALRSDAGVMSQPGLRTLGLETYSQDRIDFRVFPELTRLHLNWRPGAETAFECDTLQSLSIAGYPFADLGPLSMLTALKGLRIATSRSLRSLRSIEHLTSLGALWLLGDSAMSDLDPLADMRSSLTELWLNQCRKVTAIDPLREHRDLRRLAVIDGGRIESLAPVADLPRLEEFYLYGSTVVVDGDMAPLLRLPSLRRVAFAPRRHYSHRTVDIQRLLRLTDSDPAPHWRW